MGQGDVILTVNGGSSSVKFALYDAAGTRAIKRGQIERIGAGGNAELKWGDARSQVHAADHRAAAGQIASIVRGEGQRVAAVGHRVVHGGAKLREHVRADAEVLRLLEESAAFDRAHAPRELALIREAMHAFGGVPQVVCLDTAFHRGRPAVSRRVPVPEEFVRAGVERFGFHGLSYEFLAGRLAEVAPAEAAGRVIYAHLGSGASMAAVAGGTCVETTMGFTPLSGLVMGTRAGDLDAGVVLFMLRQAGKSPDEIDEVLNGECGMRAVSGGTSDLRDLLEARAVDPRAGLAVSLFCYRARQWIGALAATMGGLDAVVFSGGIGEHSPEVRGEACAGLGWMGVEVDAAANARGADVISAGRVRVRVIPTDEEAVIARVTAALAH